MQISEVFFPVFFFLKLKFLQTLKVKYMYVCLITSLQFGVFVISMKYWLIEQKIDLTFHGHILKLLSEFATELLRLTLMLSTWNTGAFPTLTCLFPRPHDSCGLEGSHGNYSSGRLREDLHVHALQSLCKTKSIIHLTNRQALT